MGFFRTAIEKREFSLARWQAWLDGTGAFSSGSGIEVTEASALTWSVVWACILVLSQDMAKSPLPIYRRLGRNGADGREEAPEHPLFRIFNLEANPYMTPYTYRHLMQKSLDISGNAYSIIQRNDRAEVVGLWFRFADRMEPKVQNGELIYLYTEANGSKTPYPAAQIFHLKGMSNDGITGISPVEAFRSGISVGLGYQAYAQKTFKNQVKPSIAVELPLELGTEKAKEFAKDFRETYAGPENSGKALITYGGAKIVPLGFSNKDAEFLDSQRFSVEEACRIWRVPPQKVMDLLRATFSNVTEINQSYVNDTLRPWQECWEQEIRFKLLRQDEQGIYYAEHNNYDLLKGKPTELAEVEVKYVQNGISTRDEVRRSHNWKPRKDTDPIADELTVQQQMLAPDQTAGNATTPASPVGGTR